MKTASAIKITESRGQISGSSHTEKVPKGPVHISIAIREAMDYIARARERLNAKGADLTGEERLFDAHWADAGLPERMRIRENLRKFLTLSKQ